MLRVDGVFDIETVGWDEFLVGGLLSADGISYESHRNSETFFLALIHHGGHLWCWTDYDLKWFADCAMAHGVGCDISLNGSRISSIRVAGTSLVLRDGYALTLQPLAKAATMAGMQLSKDITIDCICGTQCGGYCSLSTSMNAGEWSKVERYLHKDCISTLLTLCALSAEAERCDYTLKGTVGGSAYATARRWLGLDDAQWESTSDYRFARRAFYGGRTEVYRPRAKHGFAADINSAYPYVLSKTALPVGDYFRVANDRAKRAYAIERPGIYLARVHVPETMHIPPLPYRLHDGGVAYPVGTFAGAWVLPELQYAEELGCAVSVHGGMVWEDESVVLADFMSRVWDNRARVTREGNSSLREWHKRFGNSCYGKFAESPEKERVLLHPSQDPVACPGGDCAGTCTRWRCCHHQCVGRCRRWTPVGRSGALWASPVYRIAEHAHVHWSAYCTAQTRIKLHRQLVADDAGGATALYCDTDSVYSLSRRTHDFGPELGQWGDEGEISDFFALAPKVYRYHSPKGWTHRAKGLSGISPADWEHFADGGIVTKDRGVMGLKSAAKTGEGTSLFIRQLLSRSHRGDGIHIGSRIYKPDGMTHPATVPQVEQWRRNLAK